MPRRATILDRWVSEFERATAADSFKEYYDDPCGFARDVLGKELTKEQEEVLEAIARGDRVTVRSGRRVGKTALAGMAALWFWATRSANARVILTAPKLSQIEEVIWREIRALYQGAKKTLGGKLALRATTGLRADDGRQIVGIVGETGEAFQGIAGAEMLFIAEEASGVPEHIFGALQGNLAGGGKVLLIGNPTQNTGYFYESHQSKKSVFVAFHISSLSSPNVKAGKVVIPGLATREWVEECKSLWGETSAMFRIHVLGEFVEQQEGQLFGPAVIERAETIWPEAVANGPLCIGLDPAGEGGEGDDSAFVCRRGLKVVKCHTRRGLTADAHLVELLGLIGEERAGSWEMPRVILDRDGPPGAKIYGVFLSYLEGHKGAFHLIALRGSEKAKRKPNDIYHVRDELWFNLVEWFRAGGAIPPSQQLEGDLGAIRFDRLVNGRATVLPKRQIRKELGRSPDLGDALALACWDGPEWADSAVQRGDLPTGGRYGAQVVGEDEDDEGFDPYASSFDPYGGRRRR